MLMKTGTGAKLTQIIKITAPENQSVNLCLNCSIN